MNFNKVPPNVALQIKYLTVDEQFQERFANDETLDHLEAMKFDKDIIFQELQLLDKRKLNVLGIQFNPITLMLFSYLYSLQSNIIKDMSKITGADLDIFFYLLQTKDYTGSVKNLIQKAMGYCNKVMKVNYNQAYYIFNKLYNIQFKVMNLFPKIKYGNGENPMNVDWMLGIAAKIKPFVSYSTTQLYKDIPVMEIYYYYAHYRRINGNNSVFTRSEQQILDEMDSRMIQLVIQRLIEKGVLTKAQKEEYFKLLKEVKEN